LAIPNFRIVTSVLCLVVPLKFIIILVELTHMSWC
jgi:hypothetical protein